MSDAPRIEVSRRESDADAYRTSGNAVVETVFRWRWWNLARWRETSKGLVLIAIDVLLVLLFRFFVVEMEAWTPVIVMSAIFGLPLVAAHVGVLQFFLSSTTLTASSEGLSVQWGPIGSGRRTVARADIGQLCIAADRHRAVLAHVRGDRLQRIARHLDLEQARWLERELETVLGLEDHEVAGELPRDDARAVLLLKRSKLWPLLTAMLSIIGICVGVYFLVMGEGRTQGASLLEGPVELQVDGRDEPHTAWVVVRASSNDASEIEDLRDRTSVVLQIGDTRLSCDPFASGFHEWTSTESGLSETTFAFVGELQGCSFVARERATVRAHVETHPDVRLARLELLFR